MHRNARFTPAGRLLLCQRIEAGWPVAQAAASLGMSRDRASVWWRRYRAEGVAGLEDRSSRPRRCPNRTSPGREQRIVTLRRRRALGPARIAGIVGLAPSTVHAVLVRHRLNRLDHLDRPTRRPVRHSRTRPYRPATNGKVERFNRTLSAEWAYARPWHSEHPPPGRSPRIGGRHGWDGGAASSAALVH